MSVFFLSVTPMRRKKRLSSTCRFGPHARQQPVAKRLWRDVGLLDSRRFEKLAMRLQFPTYATAHLARRSRTVPFEPLDALDGGRLAGIPPPKAA
jgi:hypothetical protein